MNLRKFVLAAAAVACVSFAANAEIHNAIGLRLTGGSLLGGELNYQMGMGSANRLELGGSFSFKSTEVLTVKYNTNYIGIVGAYQWHFGIVDNLNWYVGPGAGVGFWSYSYESSGLKYDDNGLYVDVGGQIGIEYDFDFPLLLSVDIRPMFGLIESAGFGWGAGLGVRYKF